MSDKVFVGNIVLPDRVIEAGYVLVADGIVQHVGEGDAPAGEVHGDKDTLVLPGAIDPQVHSRSQADQEDFIWSTKSAAAGGVTTIVDMPYDDGDLICTAERFNLKKEEAGAQARVDYALYATIAPEDGTRHIDDLVAAGASAFKFSTFGTHPKRFPRIPPHLMHACFQAIAPHGLMAGVHNEDDEMIRATLAAVRETGDTSYVAHGLSRPPITEALATAQVYEIGAATGCPAHIVHCSIGRGYELAAAYRAQGHEATIEACIHYLILDEEEDVKRLRGRAKVNPPIRTRAEREALWRHLAAGNVTVVSTDHVSWSLDRKDDPDMLANASGLPGLEVLLPLLVKGLVERDLPLTHAARLLAQNPAKLFRLGATKGALEVGRDADVVLMHKSPYRYDPAAAGANVVEWSPYEGMELPYRVDAAYLRGEAIAVGGQVLAQPGNGRFLRPQAAG
ncbi:dihydroorotase [Flavisphingomonas formosensis]|uniref:dihydroorotase n=1 Tax=Flavisphingomonas formosensis TaxID=861534 RepID=UPI0012FBEBB3|nr:dihydroorotase family protein [Sphingomonas formosensis]